MLKTYEIFSFEREWSAMQNSTAFIQNNVTWFHSNIVRFALMIIDLDRPGFVHILINIDDTRTDKRETIDIYKVNNYTSSTRVRSSKKSERNLRVAKTLPSV